MNDPQKLRAFTADGVKWTARLVRPIKYGASPEGYRPRHRSDCGISFQAESGERRFLAIDRSKLPSQADLDAMGNDELVQLLADAREVQ